MSKLTWNVYHHSVNSREIKPFNIFDHWQFNDDVKKLKTEKLNETEFGEELRRLVMYYFWSKCEHEIVLTTWPPYITHNELIRLNEERDDIWATYERYPTALSVCLETGEKIDIYQQVMLNWKVFVDYVWRTNSK